MPTPTDVARENLVALAGRLQASFLGRCVRRFIVMAGIDRCIVLSSQALTALIPLLILVAAFAPSDQEDALANTLITKFGLSGEPAAAVEQLFATPVGVSSSASVFSVFLLLFSGVSFTRRLQKMYRAAWGVEQVGVRAGLFAALGLMALLIEVVVMYGIRELVRHFPPDWLWMLPISAATGLVLWTSIPYLLLNRQVHWRRLLVAGGTAAVGSAVFSVASTVYMPPLITKYTNDYGLFGITLALVGWLLAVSGVIVASTAIGAEFDASHEPWIRRLKARLGLVDPGMIEDFEGQAESAGLNKADLILFLRVVRNWLVMTAAVWVATVTVPGIAVPGGFLTYLGVSVLLGLINAVLGPILDLTALPFTVLRLGSFAFVVNGIMLAVTAGLSANLDIDGLGSAVLGALVISIVATVLEMMLHRIEQESHSMT